MDRIRIVLRTRGADWTETHTHTARRDETCHATRRYDYNVTQLAMTGRSRTDGLVGSTVPVRYYKNPASLYFF